MTDQNTPATSQYAVLPEPVRLEDTIASVETDPAEWLRTQEAP